LKIKSYLHHLIPKISVHAIANAYLSKRRKSSLLILLSSLLVKSRKLVKYNTAKIRISLQIQRELKIIKSLVSRRKR
jgi:hypothetical protein